MNTPARVFRGSLYLPHTYLQGGESLVPPKFINQLASNYREGARNYSFVSLQNQGSPAGPYWPLPIILWAMG